MYLSRDVSNEEYWKVVKEVADFLQSDGCSHAADFYIECCWEHDIHYTASHTLFGEPYSKSDADIRFRKCIQYHSRLDKFSPMSWWRYFLVKLFGHPKPSEVK